MTHSSSTKLFGWQTDSTVLESRAIGDLAIHLYEVEYRKFGSERHRAKARIRSAIGRGRKNGQLSQPVSTNPKRVDVKDFL